MSEEAPLVDPDALTVFVNSTDIQSIQLVELHGVVNEAEAEEAHVYFRAQTPQFFHDDGLLSIRVGHTVRFATPRDGEPQVEMGEVTVAHRLDLTVPAGWELDEQVLRAYVATTATFVIHPYVRQALQRYTTDMGLPTFTLPFLRRDVQLASRQQESEAASTQGALDGTASGD